MSAIDHILRRIPFGPFQEKGTRAGLMKFRKAIIPSAEYSVFWPSWKANKAEWMKEGFTPQKEVGGWWLCQWLKTDGSVTDHTKDKLEEMEKQTAEDPNALPADWIPDDVALVTPQSAKLFEYQKPGCMRLVRALRTGNALDASDTGTGKTFTALISAAELGLTPCVIAPLAVLPSWERAARALGVPLGWLINYDRIRTGRSGLGRWKPAAPPKHGEEFVYDYLPKNALIVFDECQKSKSPDSLQGQLLRDSATAGQKILCLSATAAKDPGEMRNLGCTLGLHDGTHAAFTRWAIDNGCKQSQRGLKFENKNRWKLDKLHRQIFPLKGNRIRVADLPEFPETSIVAETLECDTKSIQGAYDEMERKLLEIQRKEMSHAERQGASMAEVVKARVAAEKGKLKIFRELAEEALEEGRSVAIFLNFRDHISQLADELKTKCLIWGQQKADDRQAWIDAFQSDAERVIIVSLQAGGAGLSLHDLNGNHPRQAIISPSYSAIDLKQALGRVHRAGAKTKSFQKIVFAANTIEEEVCRSVREKLVNIDRLNDGHLAPPALLPKNTTQPETLTLVA